MKLHDTDEIFEDAKPVPVKSNEYTPIPFGRYRGTPLNELPLSYVEWLKTQDWLPTVFLDIHKVITSASFRAGKNPAPLNSCYRFNRQKFLRNLKSMIDDDLAWLAITVDNERRNRL